MISLIHIVEVAPPFFFSSSETFRSGVTKIWMSPNVSRIWESCFESVVWVSPLMNRSWESCFESVIWITPLMNRTWVPTEPE